MKKLLYNVCVLLSVFCVGQAQPSKPNVIVILADDLGYLDVGFNNPKTYYMTPTLDSLARESMVFSQFYSMPTCSPTRASLMTGCYPSRHGIYAVDAFSHTPDKMRKVLGGHSKKQLEKETYTMPVLFHSAGYQTALIGKWHLGENPLTYQGKAVFDTIIGRALKEEGHPEQYFLPTKNITFADDPNAPTYLTDRLTYEACKYIRTAKDKPFFMYLAHYGPHVPLHARKEDAALFEKRIPYGMQNRPSYAGMVYSVDRSVKMIIQQLREQNLLENTIIVFASDNGGQLMSTDNAPLRGQKGEVAEGGVRVPAFIWYKGVKKGVNTNLACVVDLLPTMASVTQTTLPPTMPLDGKSLQPLLDGKSWDRPVFFHIPAYTGNGSSNALVWQTPASVVRQGKWKLVENLEDQTVVLYDLSKDIGEKTDVAAQNPQIVKTMLDTLKKWQKETGATIVTKKNEAYDPTSRRWTEKKDKRKEKDNLNIRVE